MLAELSLPDLIALGWFAGAWLLHGLVVDRSLFGPTSLNTHLHTVRQVWMRNMLRRENRIADAQLLGHLITSVSFFASTTVLLLAGLLGVLASAEAAHRVVTDLGFITHTSRVLFELKVLTVAAILVYAFFAFTWSLRQFNYTVALTGALPIRPQPEHDAMADATARVMSMAVRAFNGGLRSYYYAFATLGWFVDPWVFMGFVTIVTVILLRRQFGSTAYHDVQTFVTAEKGE